MKKISCLIFLIFCSTIWAHDEQVFEAMNAEIQRAMQHIKIEGMESPYFISLRMQDMKMSFLSSSFGLLVQETWMPSRQVQAVVRIGSPALDNTNFNAGWEFSYYNYASVDLPFEDDVIALRQAFWLTIDDAYKNNLQQFSIKKGYLEKHPQEEYPADFLPAPEKTVLLLAQPAPIQINLFKSYVQKISQNLRMYPFLTQGDVSLIIYDMVQYYFDSEGNRHKRPEQYLVLTVSLEAYTQEWYPLKQYVSWIARDSNGLPKQDVVLAKTDKILTSMKNLLSQKPIEQYTGPVVFVEQASGQFFLDLLGNGLSRAREPLSAQESYSNPFENSVGFLTKRFGLKILPASFEVLDKPNEKEFGNQALAGTIQVDDEGMKSKDITLVSNGKLIGMPMRRSASKKFSEVNGHARGAVEQSPEATITNLFIEDKNGLSQDEFLRSVKTAAEDQGMDEILMVLNLKEDSSSSNPDDMYSLYSSGGKMSMLSNPSQMVLFNVKTHEKKPVWGLEFSNVNEKSMKDILASTKEQWLYQALSSTATSSPLSIIAPAILVEEMTLEKTKLEKLRTPSLPMPDLK